MRFWARATALALACVSLLCAGLTAAQHSYTPQTIDGEDCTCDVFSVYPTSVTLTADGMDAWAGVEVHSSVEWRHSGNSSRFGLTLARSTRPASADGLVRDTLNITSKAVDLKRGTHKYRIVLYQLVNFAQVRQDVDITVTVLAPEINLVPVEVLDQTLAPGQQLEPFIEFTNDGTKATTWRVEHEWPAGSHPFALMPHAVLNGTIAPGATVSVPLLLNATNATRGTYVGKLRVVTGDPVRPVQTVSWIGRVSNMWICPADVDATVFPGENWATSVYLFNLAGVNAPSLRYSQPSASWLQLLATPDTLPQQPSPVQVLFWADVSRKHFPNGIGSYTASFTVLACDSAAECDAGEGDERTVTVRLEVAQGLPSRAHSSVDVAVTQVPANGVISGVVALRDQFGSMTSRQVQDLSLVPLIRRFLELGDGSSQLAAESVPLNASALRLYDPAPGTPNATKLFEVNVPPARGFITFDAQYAGKPIQGGVPPVVFVNYAECDAATQELMPSGLECRCKAGHEPAAGPRVVRTQAVADAQGSGTVVAGDWITSSNPCVPCSAGSYREGGAGSSQGAALYCTPCSDSTFSHRGAARCQACPPVGASCDNGVLSLRRGFWVPPGTAFEDITTDTPLYPCINFESCNVATTSGDASAAPASASRRARALQSASNSSAGNSSAASTALLVSCAPGHQGTLCYDCEEGWSKAFGSCVQCWKRSNAMLVSVVTVSVAVLVPLFALHVGCSKARHGLYLRFRTKAVGTAGSPSARSDETFAIARLFWMWGQGFAILSSVLQVPTPERLASLFDIVASWGDVLGMDLLPWHCAADPHGSRDLFDTLYTVIPLGVGIPFIAAAVGIVIWHQHFKASDVLPQASAADGASGSPCSPVEHSAAVASVLDPLAVARDEGEDAHEPKLTVIPASANPAQRKSMQKRLRIAAAVMSLAASTIVLSYGTLTRVAFMIMDVTTVDVGGRSYLRGDVSVSTDDVRWSGAMSLSVLTLALVLVLWPFALVFSMRKAYIVLFAENSRALDERRRAPAVAKASVASSRVRRVLYVAWLALRGATAGLHECDAVQRHVGQAAGQSTAGDSLAQSRVMQEDGHVKRRAPRYGWAIVEYARAVFIAFIGASVADTNDQLLVLCLLLFLCMLLEVSQWPYATARLNALSLVAQASWVAAAMALHYLHASAVDDATFEAIVGATGGREQARKEREQAVLGFMIAMVVPMSLMFIGSLVMSLHKFMAVQRVTDAVKGMMKQQPTAHRRVSSMVPPGARRTSSADHSVDDSEVAAEAAEPLRALAGQAIAAEPEPSPAEDISQASPVSPRRLPPMPVPAAATGGSLVMQSLDDASSGAVSPRQAPASTTHRPLLSPQPPTGSSSQEESDA